MSMAKDFLISCKTPSTTSKYDYKDLIKHIEQAGAVLGQAQLMLRLDFTSNNEQDILLPRLTLPTRTQPSEVSHDYLRPLS